MTSRSGFTPHGYGIAPPHYRLPDATRLGRVQLQVADLTRSVRYYRDVVGLRVLTNAAGTASMGAQGGTDVLLELVELPGAAPVPPRGRLGLFHVAILLPDRAALGRFLSHLADIDEHAGMSDHLVSEALYLTDPDGIGLEIYADRPRAQWTVRGQELAMATEPLDVRSVLAAAHGEPWTGAPIGTRIGHVHLHVGDLVQGAAFYHEALGFDKTVWQYPGALFLAAGGYHHHLGTNTWARGAEPARATEARMLSWEILVPSALDLHALRDNLVATGVVMDIDGSEHALFAADPWGTRVRVRADIVGADTAHVDTDLGATSGP